ncbi:MAG: TetR/AcrR family transcriptional regulator [Bacteroidetes bacterium]|nr:TetR/AcrR family transcriptional regulator [Bacteroidota bacterium]
MLENITLQINEHVYLKDPVTSELGISIVGKSIDLLYELGFEDFTFKKLAVAVGSTEASIYRYFENKHKLLSYLTMWYWAWLEYRIAMGVINIESPTIRLKKCIQILTERVEEDGVFSQINEVKLNHIVIHESSKVYLNKQVDEDNQCGFFSSYKNIVKRVSDVVLEINKDFQYPHMLISTVIEGANHQRFFAKHLPRLTDVVEGKDTVVSFFQELVEKTIKH